MWAVRALMVTKPVCTCRGGLYWWNHTFPCAIAAVPDFKGRAAVMRKIKALQRARKSPLTGTEYFSFFPKHIREQLARKSLYLEGRPRLVADKDYYAPGAVWGTIAGTVTVIGPSKRRQFTKVFIHDTGQVIELMLSPRHSHPSLPGYCGMFKQLPENFWPKRGDHRIV